MSDYSWVSDPAARTQLQADAKAILRGDEHLCRRRCPAGVPCECRKALTNSLLFRGERAMKGNVL